MKAFVPFLLALLAASAGAATEVRLEALTTTEVSAAVRGGSTTILVPIGGTEQNGPHMALGKHNYRAAAFAERIARQLDRTLVAPVLAYVPEPAGHMRHAGTISVPEPVFAAVLEAAARSFRQHGFRDIVLLGDSGDYQGVLARVAARLTREWSAEGVRVHHAEAYYRAASKDFAQLLRERGIAETAAHAGVADTSLMLAVDPSRVRPGAPAAASADLGRQGADLVIEKAVAALRAALAARR